jgi:hypothetical protein
MKGKDGLQPREQKPGKQEREEPEKKAVSEKGCSFMTLENICRAMSCQLGDILSQMTY